MSLLSSFVLVPSLLGLVCLGLVYVWFQVQYTHWKRRGVKGPQPTFFEGNWTGAVTGAVHPTEVMLHLYKQYKSEPFFGIYILQKPILVVNDLELIKNVMIKDADHFASHGDSSENLDVNVFHENIFSASGQKWKDLRVNLSPVLSSGKMKNMFNLVLKVQQNLLAYLEQQCDKDVLDFKSILGCYTTDVIGSCAFGLNCNSFNEPDSDFVKYGKLIVNPKPLWRLLGELNRFMPKVLELFKINVHPADLRKFYKNLVLGTKKYRLENNIVRNDLLQLLINLGQKDTGALTDTEMVSQAFIFFLAGYETSSSAGAFALVHLAQNPHVQQKMRDEIKSVLADGPITYEGLHKMTYTEMVIEETLRFHPPLVQLTRMCTKTYEVPNSSLVIRKGDLLFIPIHGIQTDPDYYPEPERFDPERFTKEEKAKRHKCAFMPFGEGPRLCLGLRFAMMQLKLAFLGILDQYEIVATEQTRIANDMDAVLSCPRDAFVKIKRISDQKTL